MNQQKYQSENWFSIYISIAYPWNILKHLRFAKIKFSFVKPEINQLILDKKKNFNCRIVEFFSPFWWNIAALTREGDICDTFFDNDFLTLYILMGFFLSFLRNVIDEISVSSKFQNFRWCGYMENLSLNSYNYNWVRISIT
jgi:hypothetical protein